MTSSSSSPKSPEPNQDITQQDRAKLLDLFQKKDLPGGTRLAERLKKTYPKSLVLFVTLGMAYDLQEKADKSIANFEKAMALAPDSADIKHKLAAAYMKAQRHQDAHRVLSEVIKADPDNLEFLAMLASTSFDEENFEECLKHLERMRELEPDRVDTHLSIGQCLVALERIKSGLESMNKALEIEPESFDVLHLLGKTLIECNKYRDSVPHLEKAHALQPENLEVIANLATAYKDTFRIDAGIDLLEKTLAAVSDSKETPKEEESAEDRPPKSNILRLTLAHLYSIMGRKDSAFEQLNHVAETDADNASVLIQMSHFPDKIPADDIRKRLEQIYRKRATYSYEKKRKVITGFALGNIYKELGDTTKAFRTFKASGALQKELTGFSISKAEEQFRELKDEFNHITPEDYAANTTPGDRDIIFIIGMPRSGTSLTEQILSSHSRVHGAGELNFMNEETAELMYLLPKHPDVHLERKVFESIRKAYLGHLEALNTDKRIITDKMPHNFLRLGFILCAFPKAKVIHLNRDPVAVCWSCFSRFFPARGMNFTFDIEDLGHYHTLYLDLMDYWRGKFPGRIYELDYKELTIGQEEQTRRLLEYCGLEWEDACLEFHRNEREVLTASQNQVRQEMYQGSSDAWKEFAHHLRPMLKIFDEGGVAYGK